MSRVEKIFKFFKKKIKYLVLIIACFPLFYYVLIHLSYLKYWDYLKLMKFVKKHYPEEVSEGELVISSIHYMTFMLDEYSIFCLADKYEKEKKLDEGYYEGYGIDLIKDGEEILVFNVIENSPAYRSGLRIGDYILKINGKKVKGKKIKDIKKILLENESCKIQFLRKRHNFTYEKEIYKGKVEMPIVTSTMLDSETGYIKLNEFTKNSPSEFKNALKNLESLGQKKLIVDLRGNPGGYMYSCVKISSYFLNQDKILGINRSKNAKSGLIRDTYWTYDEKDLCRAPVVILVNRNSASAAEFFSGIFQDLGRGLIIGENTYGKGVCQKIYELEDGSALRITTEVLFYPSGRCIHKAFKRYKDNKFYNSKGKELSAGNGIEPDITFQENFFYLNDKLLYEYAYFKFSLYYLNELIFEDLEKKSEEILRKCPENLKEKFKKYIKLPEINEFFIPDDKLVKSFLNFCVNKKILRESEKKEILMDKAKMEKVRLELKREILSVIYGRDKANLFCLKDDNFIKTAMNNFDKAEKLCEEYYQE